MLPLRDHNPSRSTPVINYLLIVLNILMFFWEMSLGRNFERALSAVAFIPARFWSGEFLLPNIMTIFVSMFLHGGLLHIGGNMLYLWIFGNNIEDVMGHVRFVIFYLTCGIVATLSHAVIEPSSTIPMVGASGAISGVLGAYLLLFPRAQVLVLIPLGLFTRTMYVPAAFALGLWFVMQVLSGGMSLGREGGGIAFFAHIGGFVAGMALIGVFKRPDVRFFAPGHRHSSWD